MTMRRRLEGKILKREEVQTVSRLIRGALGEELMRTIASLGVDVETTVRFSLVGHQCKTHREQRGLSLKEVAAHLRMPQYRIRSIEEGRLRQVNGDVLRRYVGYLGLTKWFNRWLQENQDLAKQLFTPNPPAKS